MVPQVATEATQGVMLVRGTIREHAAAMTTAGVVSANGKCSIATGTAVETAPPDGKRSTAAVVTVDTSL